jgi:hypothetical protein
MSLASNRRGRLNNRRDSDADLAPNTVRVVGQFRCEIYATLGELPSGVFEILVDCLSSPDVGEFIGLDDTLSIPDDTTIERGPIPVFKYQLFKNRTAMLGDGYVVLDVNSPVLDLNHARTATEQEISEALGWERPTPPKPVPAPSPAYKRVDRQPNDNASYLGFRIQPGEQRPIKLAAGWTCVAFNLPVAQIVGRLDVSLNFPPASGSYLELSLYDAAGERRLFVEMTSPETQFNQVRLDAGDHMIAFRCVRGAIEGSGSYRSPNSRVISTLPEHPVVDSILLHQSEQLGPEVRCAVPAFHFASC